MDQLPDRPAALHRHRQNLDPVLARQQPALPPLRPTGTLTPGSRSTHRNRPRPHRHLLGLTPTRPPVSPPQLEWGQLTPSQRGQFRLTLPDFRSRSIRTLRLCALTLWLKVGARVPKVLLETP